MLSLLVVAGALCLILWRSPRLRHPWRSQVVHVVAIVGAAGLALWPNLWAQRSPTAVSSTLNLAAAAGSAVSVVTENAVCRAFCTHVYTNATASIVDGCCNAAPSSYKVQTACAAVCSGYGPELYVYNETNAVTLPPGRRVKNTTSAAAVEAFDDALTGALHALCDSDVDGVCPDPLDILSMGFTGTRTSDNVVYGANYPPNQGGRCQLQGLTTGRKLVSGDVCTSQGGRQFTMTILHYAALEAQLRLLVPRVDMQKPESVQIVLTHLVHPRLIDLHATNVAVNFATRVGFHALTLDVERALVFGLITTLRSPILVGFGAPFRKEARAFYALSNASTCAFDQISPASLVRLVTPRDATATSAREKSLHFIFDRSMITVWESKSATARLRYILFAPHPSVAAVRVTYAMSRANDLIHDIAMRLIHTL